MHKKPLLLTLTLLAICLTQVSGQDLCFSQFYSNQTYLNPAFAGNPDFAKLSLTYRNQWLQGQTPYATYAVGYDRFFLKQKTGVGFILINDTQDHGVFNRISFDALYSYNVQVAYNAQIRGGLQVGGAYRSTNVSKLVFPDMIDHTGTIVGDVGSQGTSFLAIDFAAGLAGQWDIFYGGFAVHHIAEPKELNMYGTKLVLPRKYTVHLGCDISVYKRYLLRNTLTFSPNIVYLFQDGFHQINIGGFLMRNDLILGAWLKEDPLFKTTKFTVVAGYHTEEYRIGYSYDFSLLSEGFRGIKTSTHEVTFAKHFEYKVRTRKKIKHLVNQIF